MDHYFGSLLCLFGLWQDKNSSDILPNISFWSFSELFFIIYLFYFFNEKVPLFLKGEEVT